MTTLDKLLRQTKKLDKKYLRKTKVPLVTVSGTYHEDLKGLHNLPEDDLKKDLVFSRAHYSMTIAQAMTTWKNKIDPKEAWIFDPTNYVHAKNWSGIKITELIGRLVARYHALKMLKNLVDKFGRQKMPILASITPPLLHFTREIKNPILSFHIAAGNILLENGKTVMQVITDPHVRDEYITNSEKPTAFFCVFDENTKEEFMRKAYKMDKKVDETKIQQRVIVTGPPIDPRILNVAEKKRAWTKASNRPLRLCLTTGGLGTNKEEIESILKQLLPELAKPNPKFQLMVYAGTHYDIKNMVIDISRGCGCGYDEISAYDPAEFEIGAKINFHPTLAEKITKPLAVIHHPQIIDANELLIHYGFPWADGFITKPSGDMAYDAVASGAFLLTLSEWGEWENNIRAKFMAHEVARKADIENILPQLEKLMRENSHGAWITEAMRKTKKIENEDPNFRNGTKNILKAFEEMKAQLK
ncbi:MAG: hypothetical protein A2383_03205 [Candidatus Pacebacteria bacterium RIFOXYB1_FULL_39_46]|nr:MAG: hypothetical protein A2182_01250 [Candidatus Pacebacteria bacterium RIFOXYA1_FULL_38_18]OGJ38425.1 MAG: hypothetical protein A2383_03205 [Candidatus Pacebacteria bacterium RIFOXYB1_FULL_39_46]OGJ40286.1 MAG: hypothetical protein A2411_03350 [Candidatus Pacebacteria bacterium RIFOXYC1_FULL_39_21]OGJ40858.1 MAG: hypothetical protein A2582_02085 [Candidatus Pacebacteria bacterium RIFOXYD1_FULL_39_27]